MSEITVATSYSPCFITCLKIDFLKIDFLIIYYLNFLLIITTNYGNL